MQYFISVLTKTIFLLPFVFFLSCDTSKEKPFDPVGKWTVDKLDYDFEIDCECTKEEVGFLRGMIKMFTDGIMEELVKGSYIQFYTDQSYKAQIFGDMEHGKYETLHDGQSIELVYNVNRNYLDVISGESQDIRLVARPSQSDLDEMTSTQYIDDFNWVTISFSRIQLEFKPETDTE